MFEVGRSYKFTMIEEDTRVSFTGVVEAYEYPLVTLQEGRIINVASPSFATATSKV
jgi:hypothetical protein